MITTKQELIEQMDELILMHHKGEETFGDPNLLMMESLIEVLLDIRGSFGKIEKSLTTLNEIQREKK